MKWSPRATELLDLLLRDVPTEYREGARRATTDEVERYCAEARIREVGYDQVVVGHIRSTPVHLRQSLRHALRAKGVIIEKYEGHFQTP